MEAVWSRRTTASVARNILSLLGPSPGGGDKLDAVFTQTLYAPRKVKQGQLILSRKVKQGPLILSRKVKQGQLIFFSADGLVLLIVFLQLVLYVFAILFFFFA